MADSSTDISTSGFQLMLNGRSLANTVQDDISSIAVQYEMNLPAMFSFEYNSFDEESGTWQGIDLKTFNLGDKVRVSMGLDELVPMMEGEITAIEPVFNENYSHVVIRGYDALYRMRFGTRLHAYTNTTDSAVVSYLAGKAGIQAAVSAPATKYPYLLQNNQSDYSFLLERADRLGYEVLIDDGKLYFRESQEGKAPVGTLTYGEDLDSFSASLKALPQGSKVEVRGWDQNNKQAISAVSGSGSELSRMGGSQTGLEMTASRIAESPVTLPTGSAVSPDDARNMAKGIYNTELLGFVEGEGMCSGMPALRSGVNVELKGLGDKFSGTYYVLGAVHTYDVGGYLTRFQVRRTAV
jgi:phage protein D